MGNNKKNKISFKFYVLGFTFQVSRFSLKNLLFTIILLFFPLLSWGAVLYIMPQSQDVWQGDSFIAEVWLDTEGETINSVEGKLIFPQDKLRVLGISEGGSVLSLWLQPPAFFNNEGSISFAGGKPNGFSGQGQLFSITFSANQRLDQRVSADINFKKDSRVLLHDGRGSLAFLSFGEGNYQLISKPANLPVITSSSHPNENKWEQNNNLNLRWKLIEGAEYSYLLSHDPLSVPDEITDKPEGGLMWQGDMAYRGLADGIYYFHLRQNIKEGWTPKITYRAMIDTTPPEAFQPQIAEIDGKKYLVFAGSDNTSGIDFYEVKEKAPSDSLGTSWQKASSPYLLEDQRPRSIIEVKAVDRAGNERLAEITPPSLPGKFKWQDIVLPTLILFGLIIVWLLWRRYTKKHE